MSEEEPQEPTGYDRPPKSTRFRPGQSGNPRGRPKGTRNQIPYHSVLGQMTTITENGKSREVTAAEAMLLHLAKQGLEGHHSAARGILSAIAVGRAMMPPFDSADGLTIFLTGPLIGNPNDEMIELGMARKLDEFLDTARTVLEPWLIEAALARLGSKRLTPDEQAKVFEVTRAPRKIRWPDWWVIKEKR